MVELVYTADLKSAIRRNMWVRVPPLAPLTKEKNMNPDQEELIYDALNALTNCSQTLCLLAYQHGTYKDRNAYQEGVYAAAVILQIALGDEALARGKARYDATRKEKT